MFTRRLAKIYREIFLDEQVKLQCFSITHGEPLLYMDRLKKAALLASKIEEKMNIKIWKKIYTNGTLFDQEKFEKLEDWGIDEIRFHTSASYFAEEVFINLEEACRRNFVVTVEEPAYPPNRKKLLNSLVRYEEAGIDHMQIGEVKVYDFNIKQILKENPDGRYYLTDVVFLYHEGLTYEIMEEVSRRNYSYSVLDCSSEISWMQALQAKGSIEPGELDSVFARYD